MKERKKFETIKKVSQVIQKLIPQRNVLVTIVDLKLPQKGGAMKIYLSIFPEKEIKFIINYLNKISRTIINDLKQELYFRYLPSKIIFYPSYEFKRGEEILRLIDEVAKEKKGSKN